MNMLELSGARFSARKYTNEAVSKQDLDYILECVRLAPSACNRQPWKFILVKSEEAKTKLRECYNRDWFTTAPMYIICMKNPEENWIRKDDDKAHGDIDLAIATEHLCLAAAERGLGTCWVCNYDVAKMKEYSRVFSNTTVQKHQFFGAQPSSQSSSHSTVALKSPFT